MEPTEKRDFNKEASQYDALPRRTKLANEIADAIIREVKPDKTVYALDFGCGTGLITLRLQPLVGTITGADGAQGMLAVLEEKVRKQKLENVRTQLVDFGKGEKVEGKFDLIVSGMTMHHIPDTAALLRFWYDLLLPNGQLCIADLDPEDGSFHPNPDGVFHRGFDRKRLKELMEGIGFRNVRDTTVGAMEKEIEGQGTRAFPVFLITAEK